MRETRTIPGHGVAKVRPEYKKKTVLVGDYNVERRDPGEAVMAGHEAEGRVHIAKRRGFSKKWLYPKELLEAMDFDGIMAWQRERSQAFGAALARVKEEDFAKVFNKGAYLAGHEVFQNVIAGVNNQGSAAGLYVDGKPLFALSGNNHTSLGGGSYYNATANAFSLANLKTARVLLEATNNRDERDQRISVKADLVLCPRNIEEDVIEVLKARGKSDTANNAANAVADLQCFAWSYLEDTDAWWVLQAKQGITFYDDDEVVFEIGEDPDTRSQALYAHSYWAISAHDFRFMVSNALATS